MDTSTEVATAAPEPKKPAKKRSFILYALIFVAFHLSVLVAVGYFAHKNIPSVANIEGCFTTTMFKVELCPKKATYVRFNQLPKHLVASLIAAEDASFYFHKGFDMDEIKASLEKSMDAGRWVRGGSTITQQLAKNLYLSQEKSLVRKMKEFFIAQEIEKKLKKPQIIEKYFNVVEFGKNIYGIHRAAYHYFQKHPSDLTPAEGAYLVSLLPSPIKYSSAFRARKELSRFNRNRVTRILSLLRLQGKISEDDYLYEVARAEHGLWSPMPFEADDESIFSGIFGAEDEESEETVEQPSPEAVEIQEELQDLNEEPALETDI